MSIAKGFLLAMMEPPPAIVEEFNDWYDTEHIPERMRVPGFEAARRFVCLSGWPRYMAFYDLASPEVLSHPQYLAVRGAGRGLWTRRLHQKHIGLYRASGLQIAPGTASTGNANRTILVRIRGTGDLEKHIVAALDRFVAQHPEMSNLRLFRTLGQEQIHHIALIEATEQIDKIVLKTSAFGTLGEHIDAINTYISYRRGRP